MAIIKNIDNLNLKGKGSYKDVDEAIANLQDADLAPKKYVDEALASEISIVNVLNFGADNSGVSDSSAAIQEALDYAETYGIRRVYVPTGEYLLRSTVYIPTEIEFFGDGMTKTIFKIDSSTTLDVIGMFDSSSDVSNFYIPLFATNKNRLSDNNNNILLKDFKVEDIYYDDTGLSGNVCPLLILRTENSKLENIHFGSVQTEKEQGGNITSSLGCSVAFSENILISKCIHNFAGYESLSIRFLSKNITTEFNVFDIDKPSNLVEQVHASQTARPTPLLNLLMTEYGKTKVDGYKSINDTYLLKNNVQHAFTSHASKNVKILGANVIANRADGSGFYIFKIFDNTIEAEVSECVITVIDENRELETERVRGGIIGIGSTAFDSDSNTENVIVSNNTINVINSNTDEVDYRAYASIIGNTMQLYHNSIISNNVINIDGYNDAPFHAIGVYGYNNIVSDNIINFNNPVNEGNTKAVGVLVYGGDRNNIFGNIINGEVYNGIKILAVSELNNLLLNGNNIYKSISSLIDIPNSRKGAVKIGQYVSSIDFIEPVSDLEVTDFSTSEISIEWSIPISVKTIESIEVYVDGGLIDSLIGTSQSYTITGLDRAKTYSINIILVYSENQRVQSNLIYQKTDMEPFITTWKTDNIGDTNNTSIKIPTAGSGYNYDVDWGDGSGWKLGYTGDAEYDYGIAGTYTIKVRGDFPRMQLFNSGEEAKILSIEQWGDIEWKIMNSMFRGAINLNGLNVSDTPDLSKVTYLGHMFFNASSFNSDLSEWDVSKVTDMNRMFYGASSFDSDLGQWDVSQVTDFTYFLVNVKMSTENYSNTLIGWANNPNGLQPSLSFHGGNSKYNAQGAIARQYIIDTYGWTFVDGGPE